MRGKPKQPGSVSHIGGGARQVDEAFTLVELLTVIAIIGLLVGIMVPALSKARAGAQVAVCKANLGQLGLAIIAYADQHEDLIPRGPACTGPFDFACADVATNQLWIGAQNELYPRKPIGLGVLLQDEVHEPKIYFCPADDTNNLQQELPKIGSDLDAFGSYTYRQLDQLPPARQYGALSNLGANVVDEVKVPVEALAMDTNSLGPGPLRHTNHGAKKVNVLYRDRSVKTFSNRDGPFSIPPETYESFENIFIRLDQIFVNADYAYRHDPATAPQLPEPEPEEE